MKKISIFLLAATTLVVCFAFAKISSTKSFRTKPSTDGGTCYTWDDGDKNCSGAATNCSCNHGVSQSIVSGLNTAISNNTIGNFFSNNQNVEAFGLNQTQVDELTSSGCWVLSYFNQQQGIVYYAVGLSATSSFNNADFILNITPSGN